MPTPTLFDDLPDEPTLFDDLPDQPGRMDAVGRSLSNAMTFNLADEAVASAKVGSPYAGFGDRIAAGLETVEQYVPEWLLGSSEQRERAKNLLRSHQQEFDRHHAAENRSTQEARGEYPNTSLAADIGGGVATGLGMANKGLSLLGAANPTIGSMAARGAAEGGMYGAAYGFGAGDDLGDRLTGAATGAAISAPLGGVLGGGGGALAQRGFSRSIPATDELTAKAHQLYDAAKQSGIAIKPDSFQSAASSIRQTAAKEGFHPKIHPKVAAALDELEVAGGGPVDFQHLDQLRRIAGSAARSIEPDEQRLAAIVIDKIDDFADSLSSQHVVGGADPRATVGFLKQARALWARRSKADTIEVAIERAQDRAAQYSNSGIENALRTEFRKIATNPKRLRRFSKSEQEAIKKVSRGGAVENAVRLMGKLAIRGPVSVGPHFGVGYFAGPWAAAGTAVAGEVGKRASGAMTGRNARLAAELMRAGGKRPDAQQISPVRRSLIDAVLAGQGAGAN